MIDDRAWRDWEAALYARVATLRRGELDADTRRRAALVVIDDLAAMVAAVAEPEVAALAATAGRVAPSPEAAIVGGGRAGRGWAALVNAVAAGWNELDEGYRPATCHGGLYALPAAMAEVEAVGGTVGDLLAALVGGYEVSTAYARVMPAPRPLVWHPHATLSPIGAAAAVSVARGADAEGIAAAAHLAASFAAAGPFRHAIDGVTARNAWAGHGALTGFTAVECAAAGLAADGSTPLDVFHVGFGYPLSPAELAAPPDRWAIHDGYHKQYACCQYLHSSVEAALQLVSGPLRGVAPDDIVEVVVETHPLAEVLDDADPRTVLGGKFSLPHAVAAVLARGDAAPETFGLAHLHDERIRELRQRVTIAPFPGPLDPPADRPGRVSVRVRSGREHVAECLSAVGGPDRPLTDGDVLEKAERLTAVRAPRFVGVAEALLAGEVPGDADWAEVLGEMWSAS